MTLLEKSRPTLTTSRTCEYSTTLWLSGAINTERLMSSDRCELQLIAKSII